MASKGLFVLVLVLLGCSLGSAGRKKPACEFAGFTLPDLPYSNDALEPDIDEQTMMIHHDTHHAGYMRNLNAALGEINPCEADMTVKDLLLGLGSAEYPENVTRAIRNHGGGFFNHDLYWKIMTPEQEKREMLSDDLGDAISSAFGSVDDLKVDFLGKAGKVFGSGWGWLCVGDDGELLTTATANQDNPLMDVTGVEETCCPILGVDVWEHAYYLKRQAGRKDYLDAFWNVINWAQVSDNYAECIAAMEDGDDE